MFLLRSAFWLTLAFVVIRPEVDVRDAASTLSLDAMAAGSQFISQQIDAIECDTFQCHGGKAVAVAALKTSTPAIAAPQAVPEPPSVPLPRPRPQRAV